MLLKTMMEYTIMRIEIRRVLTMVLAAVLAATFVVTANAQANPNEPIRDSEIQRAPETPDEDTAENTQTSTTVKLPVSSTQQSEKKDEQENGEPLTPEGNMTLVDDVQSETEENKQFITVVTKDGNYFYIIIDRAAEGENTVHFLNQVDEEDLQALMEEEQKEETPIVCSCTEKCTVGNIKTDCQICMAQMSKCVGEEPEPVVPEEPDDTEQEPEKKPNTGALLMVVLLMVAGGAAAFYFLILKPKRKPNAPDPLEDFDLEEEYYDETEDNL